ncbi:hypothetical protein PMI16_02595 [Herbaspirillum sp. CF444]|nr:hypothetical protein PMI16_02595 [Herbaspirillum sp. CF444]
MRELLTSTLISPLIASLTNPASCPTMVAPSTVRLVACPTRFVSLSNAIPAPLIWPSLSIAGSVAPVPMNVPPRTIAEELSVTYSATIPPVAWRLCANTTESLLLTTPALSATITEPSKRINASSNRSTASCCPRPVNKVFAVDVPVDVPKRENAAVARFDEAVASSDTLSR